jgi:MFS transporter, PAT family, solute carrier family 33 (acetyl-CoA transportor), member 1
MSIKNVYKTIWTICKLKRDQFCDFRYNRADNSFADIQWLIFIHLFAKIGFSASEAVTSLKMVEKGLKREDLAIAVLIDFPFQILAGWQVARWSRGDKPLRPWVIAFWPRLGFSLIAALIIYWFPSPPISMGFFVLLVIYTVLSGFAS